MPLPVRVASGPDVDDPGNKFDTDGTVLANLSHNALYHTACGGTRAIQ